MPRYFHCDRFLPTMPTVLQRQVLPTRTMFLGAATVLCLASAPTLGMAASLKGKPFLLDPEYAEIGAQYGVLFNYGKGFAASFAVPKGGVSLPNEIHYKTFNKSGKTDVKKTLIAKAKKGPGDVNQLYGAGGFDLGGKKSVVGYIDVRFSNREKAVGGVFGQATSKTKPSGDEQVFDNSKKNRTEVGSIIALADKRGLAYWETYDESAGTYTAGARFIGRDGKPDGKPVNISRQSGLVQSVLPFGSGFIVIHRDIVDFTVEDFYAQAYDADGNKSGEEGVLSKDVEWGVHQFPVFITVGKKNVAFLSLVPNGAGIRRLQAQIFNKKWEKVGANTVLMNKIDLNRFVATTLPGGDFLVAAVVGQVHAAEEGKIEVRRFDKQLKQSGPAARTNTKFYTELDQMIALKGSDAVLMYRAGDSKLIGQIIKP